MSSTEAPQQENSSLTIWSPIVIAMFSLFIAGMSLWYTKQQTTTAKKSLVSATEQLELAKVAQATAEKNYLVAKQQLDIQRQSLEDDNKFPVVYDRVFLNALISPIQNQQVITVAFVNRTKRAQSYWVAVEAEGVGVYWVNARPDKIVNRIYLDRNPVVVAPDAEYRESFVVWHATQPLTSARLRLYINEVLKLENNYHYNAVQHTYLPSQI